MKVDNFVSNRLKNYNWYISVTTRPPLELIPDYAPELEFKATTHILESPFRLFTIIFWSSLACAICYAQCHRKAAASAWRGSQKAFRFVQVISTSPKASWATMTKVVEVFVTAASTLSLTAFDGGSHLSLDLLWTSLMNHLLALWSTLQ